MCMVEPLKDVCAVTYVDIRGRCQVSFSAALCIASLRLGLSINLIRLPGHQGLGIYFSLPTCAELTGTQGHAQVYKNLGAGGLNSVPLVFTAGALIRNSSLCIWTNGVWETGDRDLLPSLCLIINLVTKCIFFSSPFFVI